MYKNLRKFITELASENMREDKRKLDEFREIGITKGISKKAEGSARIRIGKTDVMVGIKMAVGEPFSDRPKEGVLMTGAEFLPMANPEFEPGPPSENAIELARVVDRGIRESKMVDLKSLFIEAGKVWMVYVDIYVINDDGNLIDASSLGAIAALQDAKMPGYKDGMADYEKRTKKGLPITVVPTTTSITRIGEHFFVDTNRNEEKIMDTRLTVTVSDSNRHAMQKSGEGTLKQDQVIRMVETAFKKRKELLKVLK
jgi:exosome complex component RRP42